MASTDAPDPGESDESSAGSSTRDRGRAVEQAVAAFLRAHGLEIVETNFEGAGAELDLIARERSPDGSVTYVFIEVRSRASTERGTALETIDRRKQRRVIRAATTWLVARDLWERVEVRFDAIGVDPGSPSPIWIRNAFEADG